MLIGVIVIFGLMSSAPNFQGTQFLKLPELIQHYTQHQSGEDSFSSFLAFIKEHYFNHKHHGKNEQHMPFKTTGISYSSVMTIEFPYIHYIVSDLRNTQERTAHFGEPNGSLNDFSGSIWHPPQMI
jgi:hypothetical protein